MSEPLRNQFLRSFDGVVSRTIFVPWISDERPTEIQVNACWKSLTLCGCPIVVVNRYTLERWIHPEYPLPAPFHTLNASQSTSYLRCYLMHVYGGGLATPSSFEDSWDHSFDCLEFGVSVAIILGKNREELSSVICRRDTQFSEKWYSLATDAILSGVLRIGDQISLKLADDFASEIFGTLAAEFEKEVAIASHINRQF
jgi:hypothetical protein